VRKKGGTGRFVQRGGWGKKRTLHQGFVCEPGTAFETQKGKGVMYTQKKKTGGGLQAVTEDSET